MIFAIRKLVSTARPKPKAQAKPPVMKLWANVESVPDAYHETDFHLQNGKTATIPKFIGTDIRLGNSIQKPPYWGPDPSNPKELVIIICGIGHNMGPYKR